MKDWSRKVVEEDGKQRGTQLATFREKAQMGMCSNKDFHIRAVDRHGMKLSTLRPNCVCVWLWLGCGCGCVCLLACLIACLLACLLACLFVCLIVCLFVCLFVFSGICGYL